MGPAHPAAGSASTNSIASEAGVGPGENASTPVMIGPYRVVKLIGEGGFGNVYLAEQDRPVKRTVAVKVIRPGMDSAGVVARFEAERQALAVMDHPCVAKVFDAGTTPPSAGLRPYFVMEYVPGEPITDYCTRAGLSTRARLELFILVCEAVQHAHQKGIVHRDLKPSNILVSVQRVGEREVALPKVIDFGIAKAVSEPLTDRPAVTAQGQMIGTPEYMSPEQAVGSRQDVDTRTDVYALGVVLYELLTGTLPFDSDRLRGASLFEVQRMIRDEEPPLPSVRLDTVERSARALGSAALSREAARSRQLRGDLDWITMRAMEKDRARRYQTPAALADDVRRHLADEPVLAGPPSTVYRVGKFVRRNTLAVVSGAVVVAALVAGLGLAGYGLSKARRERDAAIVAESRAARESRKTSEVNLFLLDMLAAADPRLGRARDMTVREAVDEAAARLDADPPGTRDPEVEAAIRGTIGSTYGQLDRFEEAEKQLRAALALRQGALGREHADTAAAMCDLGGLLWDLGKNEEAERLCREGVEIGRRVLAPDDPGLATSINNLATSLNAAGRADEALPVFREALAIQEKAYGKRHRETALTLNNIALVLMGMGRREEAESAARQALEVRAAIGAKTFEHAQAMNTLGGILMSEQKFADAEVQFRAAASLYAEIVGPAHSSVGASLNNVGGALFMQGKFAEAEPVLRRAIEIRSASLPPGSVEVAQGHKNLSRVLRELEKYDDAEREGLEAYRLATTGDESARAAAGGIALELVDLYSAWGKPEQAAEWKARAASGG